MSRLRVILLVLAVFAVGVAVGAAAVLAWPHLRGAPPLMTAAWQATLYVPTRDNDGRPFTDAEWEGALRALTDEFGGATVGAEQEGWWRDGRQRLRREPVRVVVVSFDRDRLGDFRRAVRELGRRLGQEAVYFRLEEARVEVLPVGGENSQNGP